MANWSKSEQDQELKKAAVYKELQNQRWNKMRTAKVLKIGERDIYRIVAKLKAEGIHIPRFKN